MAVDLGLCGWSSECGLSTRMHERPRGAGKIHGWVVKDTSQAGDQGLAFPMCHIPVLNPERSDDSKCKLGLPVIMKVFVKVRRKNVLTY